MRGSMFTQYNNYCKKQWMAVKMMGLEVTARLGDGVILLMPNNVTESRWYTYTYIRLCGYHTFITFFISAVTMSSF